MVFGIHHTVAIHILVVGITRFQFVDGLRCQRGSLFLRLYDACKLIAIEGAERFANSHNQRRDVAQRGTTDAGNNRCGLSERGHLVFVVRDIGIDVPLPVLAIDEYGTHLQFNTLVGDRTHIAQ